MTDTCVCGHAVDDHAMPTGRFAMMPCVECECMDLDERGDDDDDDDDDFDFGEFDTLEEQDEFFSDL